MEGHFSTEFKEQLVSEYQEVGNVALVARRHNLAPSTVSAWIKKGRKEGSVSPLPRDTMVRMRVLRGTLENVSKENDSLKRQLAEQNLQISILEEARDSVNPR